VTERKKTTDELKETLKDLKRVNAELKHLGQMKDDFFSNVSHELKTPMISVMGYIGMLLKEKVGGLTEQQRRFLDVSYKNLLKLEKTIDNLFDLAELGIRKGAWTFETVNLSGVVDLSCSTIEPLAQEHQISLEMHLSREPVFVRGVEDKLNQLFDNLLTNAIKYNRQGGRISVDLQEDNKFAYARIMDTGVGISHQSLEEVFTRRPKKKPKPLGNFKALGIGLSLVQEIVTLHHGEIHLERELSKGTTVTVKLPKSSAPPRVHPSPS
jgi:signal transduction histidine kinase